MLRTHPRQILAVILTSLFLLTACGTGGNGTKSASTSASTTADNGTWIAAEVCTEALTKQTGLSDDAIVALDKAVADTAASAAVSNPKWKDLAKATSDWALTRQDLAQITKRLQTMSDAEFMTEMAQVSARVGDARRGLIAACRIVKASGGKVDETLLNSL